MRCHLVLTPLVFAIVASTALAQPPAPPTAKLSLPLDGPGFAIAYNETADMLAAGTERGSIHLWPTDFLLGVRAGRVLPFTLQGHAGAVTALAWHGTVLASAGADQKILLWNVADQKTVHTLATSGITRAMAMSPDGKLLVSAGDDPAIQLWDTAAGKPIAKLEAHADWVAALAFSRDGKRLASGGYDGMVRIWDVEGRKKLLDISTAPAPVANTPPAPPVSVLSLAFSPDAAVLAVGGTDAKIQLLNTADGKPIRTIAGHGSSVTGIAFHPGGSVLVSTGRDNAVRLWNPADGKAIKALEGHTGWVQGLALLGHGSHIASLGADQAIRVWETAAK